MNCSLRNRLRIPVELQEEYWQEALRKNTFSLWVNCIITIAVELYNIARVLFLSASGLGTRNNRIYFGMYCALLALAALWPLVQRVQRRASWRARWGVQYAMIVLCILWHVCLNAYDLRVHPKGDVIVYFTAILALSMFIQMPALYSLPCIGAGYGLFLLAAAPALESGQIINVTIATLVALGVSFANFRHAVDDLKQRRELREMNAKLQELACQDSLTGLLNAGALKVWVERYLDAAEGATLFIIDMDDFKRINDTYGHPCGDEVLKEAALRMRRAFPGGGQLGRIGGDEFAAVFPESMRAERAAELGAQIIREISKIHLQRGPVNICCSVGVCRSQGPGVGYLRLYQEADQALYQAKGVGKGRCCVRMLARDSQGECEAAARSEARS